MAILKIARMGHPVLSRIADPVADPTDPEVLRLIGDMIETMEDAGGAGLAAPQVHVPLRVVVFHAPAYRNEGVAVPLTVLINPMVEPLDAERHLGYEGCLSLPGLTGKVPRFTHIRYGGYQPSGAWLEREAQGFHARVVQHECDHLDGVLYPMRMDGLASFGFADEVRRAQEELA
ncbi:peptide deformylase [Magnetospirillum moscoviense]|uniref:Peptide deformylase n=1 Tax=Magnetospirillum moscoviense TaxID=1437059 RepID=A0A178MUP4_9PROT|nr:peptide deformylase [Magnetospirillum moscoviense]OAN52778.1 peptide deformylase [Magnetospirillum moscoviense]